MPGRVSLGWRGTRVVDEDNVVETWMKSTRVVEVAEMDGGHTGCGGGRNLDEKHLDDRPSLGWRALRLLDERSPLDEGALGERIKWPKFG